MEQRRHTFDFEWYEMGIEAEVKVGLVNSTET